MLDLSQDIIIAGVYIIGSKNLVCSKTKLFLL